MPTILVVDDRPVNRQFLTTLLGYGGHQLLEAEEGAEALAVVRSHHPDLVITDIVMPGMDGCRFVEELRADPQIASTPIIFYTATYRVREARMLAQACGVSTVISKPSEPQAILDIVNKMLAVQPVSLPTLASIPQVEKVENAGEIAVKLTEYLTELQGLSNQMANLVGRGEALADQRIEIRRLADQVTASVNTLQTVSLQMAALVELGLDLARQREPQSLLDLCCRAAHKIINGRFAGLGVLQDVGVLQEDPQNLGVSIFRGVDDTTLARFGNVPARAGFLGQVIAERRSFRLHGHNGDVQILGLPPGHPPVHSFLAVPIASAMQTFGWLYVAEKLGADHFSIDDENIALTLAAHTAVAYENVKLVDEIQRHSARLQLEVAERRKAQNQVLQLNADLTQRADNLAATNQELEAFSYSVSHDLRSPLQGINGFAQALLHEYSDCLPRDGQQLLHLVQANAEHMESLVQDLLAFSRLGRQDLQKQLLSPADIAALALQEVCSTYDCQRLKVSIANLPPCRADPNLLRQVYVNLISNACKFSRTREAPRVEVGFQVSELQSCKVEGVATMKPETLPPGPAGDRGIVNPSGSEGKPEIVYYVRDNGVGFDMQQAGKLFGVFQRLHREDEFEGNGVGLAIVQRIIHRHGGRIWAQARVSEGATLYFTLDQS